MYSKKEKTQLRGGSLKDNHFSNSAPFTPALCGLLHKKHQKRHKTQFTSQKNMKTPLAYSSWSEYLLLLHVHKY